MTIHQTIDPAKAAPLMKTAAIASVLVATVLIVAKAIAWAMSGSVAMLGSLVDSGLDLMASLTNLFAVRIALVPPDEDHRFGHGKAEPIAGLFQSSIILGSSVFLLLQSGSRLMNPVVPDNSEIAIGVSVLAILLTFALVTYQRHVVSKTGSVAISADRLHYTGDLLLNLGVIVALLISAITDYAWVDGLFGILIAIFIARQAIKIFRQSIDMLMDKEFNQPDRDRIFELVMGNDHVHGLHDLKTRQSGISSFIQMHIELDPALSLFDAHHIADEVEATVGEAFSGAEIIIHTDPFGLEDPDHTLSEAHRPVDKDRSDNKD